LLTLQEILMLKSGGLSLLILNPTIQKRNGNKTQFILNQSNIVTAHM
jgi:hypothetical protein